MRQAPRQGRYHAQIVQRTVMRRFEVDDSPVHLFGGTDISRSPGLSRPRKELLDLCFCIRLSQCREHATSGVETMAAFSGLRTVAATGRVLTRLALAGVLLLTSGCAMVQMGYTHLDTLAAFKADEYFDLDPQQKQEFRARFDRLHEWHRREQLPEYAAFLTEVKSRLSKPPTREDIVWIATASRSRYRVMCGAAAPGRRPCFSPRCGRSRSPGHRSNGMTTIAGSSGNFA
jgi:hypothetical protein